MKKLFTLVAAAVMATAMWADSPIAPVQIQRTKMNQPVPAQNINIEHAAKQAPASMQTSVPQEAVIRSAQMFDNAPAARKAAMADTLTAFYMRPEGTLNCGIDPVGTYIFVNYPAIIGSWMNGIDAWKWRNYSNEYDEIKYENIMTYYQPQYADEMTFVDEEGNWYDSIAAGEKFDADYLLGYRVPLQIVSKGIEKDSFVTATEYSARLDTIIKEMWTIRGVKLSDGLPDYFYDEEGFPEFKNYDFWPLTNASFFDFRFGLSMMGIWNTDKTTKTVEYVMGSSTVTTSTGTVYKPATVLQFFEKPMSPLYVHDVTLPICALSWQGNQFDYCAPTFDSLAMIIMDTAMTKVLATSIATIKDTTNMLYVNGAMVNFKIEKEDEMGGKEIGVVLDEPFIVMIQGLNRPKNNFGIYCGIDMMTGGNTFVLDANTKKIVHYVAADAFIQLNGLYYTLEDGTGAFGYEPYPSDTIDVVLKHFSEEGYDEYLLVCANGGMEGYVPLVASMDLLYDTLTYQYNYDIIAPDWAEMDMSYSAIVDDYGSTVWDYGCYFLYIDYYPEDNEEGERPEVGDEIKLSKYGKEIIYRVVEVPWTDLEETQATIKNGKRYDVLGRQVGKDYKGVMLMNNAKYLQK